MPRVDSPFPGLYISILCVYIYRGKVEEGDDERNEVEEEEEEEMRDERAHV